MIKRIIFITSFIILVAAYLFSAAAVDAGSDILCENNTAIHPVVKQIVDSYIRYSTKTGLMKETGVITGNGGLDLQPAGLSEGFFTPAEIVQYQSSDYFPLYPGTVWKYLENGNSEVTTKVLPKLVKVNGVMTSVLLCGCGQKEYYTSDSNGVMLHRLFIPKVFIPRIGQVNLSVTLIPPLKMSGDLTGVGQTFNTSGIARYNNLPVIGTIKLPYDADFTFSSLENVSVPAGDFEVLKITGNLTINGQSASYTFYLAKDIGIVKEVSDGTTQELTAVYYVKLSSPSEAEIIPSGNSYPINWTASQDTAYFKLLYSKDNGTTWVSITPDLITGTSLDWNVPSPKNNKTACLIKIIGYDSDGVEKTSVVSKPFTIEVVKLTSPDGGETLTSNSSWPITWSTNVTNTPVAKVILKYTTNGGATWKTITKITGSNPGTFDWNVPVVSREKNKCKVKIILQNANGKVVGTDASDVYFTISP